MRIRSLDSDGDWTFGKGRNNYLEGKSALALDIKTRLQEHVGDCFFNLTAGVDWFGLLGQKTSVDLSLAVGAVILNTKNVTGILSVSEDVISSSRAFNLSYNVSSVFGQINGYSSINMNVGV